MAPPTPLPITSDLSEITLGNFDVNTALENFNENEKKFLTFAPFKLDKRPLLITFDGIVACDRILVSDFDKFESYSLAIEFDDDEISEIFSTFSETISSHLLKFTENASDWTLTDIVKGDKIYLKIKFDKKLKTPLFQSNIPINYKKIHDTKFYQGQKVTVTANVNFYMNVAEKVGGPTLVIKALDFEGVGDEEDVEIIDTPKRKAKTPLVPETPRKPKKVASLSRPVALPLDYSNI